MVDELQRLIRVTKEWWMAEERWSKEFRERMLVLEKHFFRIEILKYEHDWAYRMGGGERRRLEAVAFFERKWRLAATTTTTTLLG